LSSISAEGRRHRRRPVYGHLLSILDSMLTLVLTWRERSRDRRELARLSERELNDVGLCRADVADEIDRPFWRK